MTPFQHEDLDRDMNYESRDLNAWYPRNRWTREAYIERAIHKAIPWVCFGIAVPVLIIAGAETLFHLWAFFR